MRRFEIGHVRAHRVEGPPAHRQALRSCLSAALSHADLHPPGIPPAAVLIVRHLSDPLPGGLTPAGGLPRADAAWERAVRDSLADHYRTAARPRGGRLPDDANAVVFCDESELIACLTLDLIRGRARRRWWWQTSLRRLPSDPLLAAPALLEARPAHLPAVLHHLTEWEVVEEVLSVVSPPAATRLLTAQWQAFHLPPLQLEASEENGSTVTATPPALPRHPQDHGPAPWAPEFVAPALIQRLGHARAALLGTALMLHRRRRVASAPHFREALRSWWAQQRNVRSGRSAGPRDELPPAPQPRAGGSSKPVADRHRPAGVADADALHQSPGTSQSSEDAAHQNGVRSEHGETANHRRLPAASRQGREPDGQPLRQRELPAGEAPFTSEARHARHRELSTASAADAPLHAPGVPTQLGGVFYLINVMTHLGLPDVFEADWHLASMVGPWGVLEALGRALLGRRMSAFADDPLWAAVAELDGRPAGAPAGADLSDPDRFHIPPVWADQLSPEKSVHWAATRTRLAVWTLDGILLADVPRVGRPADQVQSVLRTARYPAQARPAARRPYADRPAALPCEDVKLEPALHRWTACVFAYVRRRLADALRRPPLVGPTEMLLATGSLHVTASHVDLMLPLEAISLPVRRAGLDRDPGWLPAFGRVVLFHYT